MSERDGCNKVEKFLELVWYFDEAELTLEQEMMQKRSLACQSLSDRTWATVNKSYCNALHKAFMPVRCPAVPDINYTDTDLYFRALQAPLPLRRIWVIHRHCAMHVEVVNET